MCSRAVLLSLFFLSFPWLACAHDSEPINTDFASPLARHSANVNFDLQHFRRRPNEDVAAVGFEYGIAGRMQFSIGIPLARSVLGSGVSVVGAGNLALSYRYLLAGGNEKPFALSINPEAEFPTGNPGVAGRAYTVGTAIHLDAHRGDKLWLHSNWGYETPVAHSDEKERDFNFAVAGMYEMREKLHSVIELFGQRDFNSHSTQMSVAPEMIYSLGEHWELKAAIPIGATSSTPTVGIQVRVTWKIGPPVRQ